MRVLIIGAGLGGLTLAHGLRQAGIDAEVFDRTTPTGRQPASYGIHIDADGAHALHACLPEQNWALFDAGSVPARDVIRFRNARLRVLATNDRDTPEAVSDPITHRRAVRRQSLHTALLHGLASEGPTPTVNWSKTFESYRTETDGTVVATFADGTTARGDLLVGADGSNSRVRHQYLPQLRRHDLGIVNIAGRLPLEEAASTGLPASVLDSSINNIVPAGPGWMFASTWRMPTIGQDPGEDYLVWAYVAGRSSRGADVELLEPAQLRHVVADRVAAWHPALRRTVTASDTATIAPVVLRSMPTLPHWQPSTVTLLGDAIHNMTPMAGIGANTALRDADILRVALLDVLAARTTLLEAVGDYERRMRHRANDALALSTRNARNAATDKRSSRTAFRTLLRVAGAVPPLRRAMFPPPARSTQTAATRTLRPTEPVPAPGWNHP